MATDWRNFKAQNEVSDRNFGFTFAVIFCIIAIILFYKSNDVWWIAALVSLAFAVMSFYKPVLLQPLNRIWYLFGVLLQKTISPIVLLLIFVIFMIPIGFIRKFIAKKTIPLKPNPTLDSYWVQKNKPQIIKEDFKHLF